MTIGKSHDTTSIDEFMATIKRSSLPTLITEGMDDAVVFRRFEREFSSANLSLMPVGGRDRVLEIFSRRDEFQGDQLVIFLSDKDTWCVTGIPKKYLDKCMLFTSGYSIENDLYVDLDVEAMLTEKEYKIFKSELKIVCEWYSIMLSRHLQSNPNCDLSYHPSRILDTTPKFDINSTLVSGETFPQQLFNSINSDYKQLLRGKTLLNLVVRHLSYKGRVPRHHHLSLMEMAANIAGPNMVRIRNEVATNLGLSAA